MIDTFGKNYIEALFRAIPDETIMIFKDSNGNACVSHQYCDVKEGCTLKSICGRGNTVEEAAYDYIRRIAGEILVFHAESSNRKEYKVILLDL